MKQFLFSSLMLINANLFAQLTNGTLTLQPGAAEGKDATISSRFPNSPMENGNNPEFNALAWTNGGNFDIFRSLIDFDLSSIPVGAQITNAILYLYWDPTSSNPGHSTLSGSNTAIVQRIISNWDEATVTWNTQPTVTTTNQILLPQSSSETQNYEINITNLVQDYYNNPSGSFGFMIRLQTEVQYRSLIFASSDNSSSSLHPKIVVDYSYNLNIDENDYSNLINIFPNPSSEIISIQAPLNYTYELYNIAGKKVAEEKALISKEQHSINVSEYTKGTYLLNIKLENGAEVKKSIVVN